MIYAIFSSKDKNKILFICKYFYLYYVSYNNIKLLTSKTNFVNYIYRFLDNLNKIDTYRVKLYITCYDEKVMDNGTLFSV